MDSSRDRIRASQDLHLDQVRRPPASYRDAGGGDDGIPVLRGAGRQYAAEGSIDQLVRRRLAPIQ